MVTQHQQAVLSALRELADETPAIPRGDGREYAWEDAEEPLAPADFEEAAELVADSLRARSSEVESSASTYASTRSDMPPMEDSVYIPRDAITSIVQASIEQTFRDEGRAQSVGVSGGKTRSGDPLPPVTDEFVDGRPLERIAGPDEKVRFGGPFEVPSDIRWASVLVAKAIRLRRHKHPFVDAPSRREIDRRARVLIVGDWGTGIPRARAVAAAMRTVLENGLDEGLEQHVVHLGDVYYAGFDYEYRRRVLPNWPVLLGEEGAITSWSLVGNHDMYAGGWGYWRVLLADPRFAGHNGCSYFQLANDAWNIFGVDSGWEHEHGSLPGKQLDWLSRELTASDRRSILLSHHPLFSVYSSGSKRLRATMLPLLERHPVDAWLWGHEHRCVLYDAHEHVSYARCLGHGGVPEYQWHMPNDPISSPGLYEYRDILSGGTYALEPWGIFGFAVLDLDGRKATVRYVNEFGVEHHPRDVF